MPPPLHPMGGPPLPPPIGAPPLPPQCPPRVGCPNCWSKFAIGGGGGITDGEDIGGGEGDATGGYPNGIGGCSAAAGSCGGGAATPVAGGPRLLFGLDPGSDLGKLPESAPPAPSSSTSNAGGGVGFTARPVVSAMPRKRPPSIFPTRGASPPPGDWPLFCGESCSLSSRRPMRKESERRLCGTALTKACNKVMHFRALSTKPTSAKRTACASLNGCKLWQRASASPQRMQYSNISDSCKANGSRSDVKFFGFRCSTPMRQTMLAGASTESSWRWPVSKWHKCAPKTSPFVARPVARTSSSRPPNACCGHGRNKTENTARYAGQLSKASSGTSGKAPWPKAL
mmetsp:Transcript_49131/g.141241  ORF Transcript_49131/g.141241 Transcript_49131/m.141241 type:complete len:342 (-) Transcript_49131:1172-2197(-)